MNDQRPGKPLWQRIAVLTLWLCLAPPWGLWKLYHDATLSASVKWRILIYLCLLPALLYITVSIWWTSSILQKSLP